MGTVNGGVPPGSGPGLPNPATLATRITGQIVARMDDGRVGVDVAGQTVNLAPPKNFTGNEIQFELVTRADGSPGLRPVFPEMSETPSAPPVRHGVTPASIESLLFSLGVEDTPENREILSGLLAGGAKLSAENFQNVKALMLALGADSPEAIKLFFDLSAVNGGTLSGDLAARLAGAVLPGAAENIHALITEFGARIATLRVERDALLELAGKIGESLRTAAPDAPLGQAVQRIASLIDALPSTSFENSRVVVDVLRTVFCGADAATAPENVMRLNDLALALSDARHTDADAFSIVGELRGKPVSDALAEPVVFDGLQKALASVKTAAGNTPATLLVTSGASGTVDLAVGLAHLKVCLGSEPSAVPPAATIAALPDDLKPTLSVLQITNALEILASQARLLGAEGDAANAFLALVRTFAPETTRQIETALAEILPDNGVEIAARLESALAEYATAGLLKSPELTVLAALTEQLAALTAAGQAPIGQPPSLEVTRDAAGLLRDVLKFFGRDITGCAERIIGSAGRENLAALRSLLESFEEDTLLRDPAGQFIRNSSQLLARTAERIGTLKLLAHAAEPLETPFRAAEFVIPSQASNGEVRFKMYYSEKDRGKRAAKSSGRVVIDLDMSRLGRVRSDITVKEKSVKGRFVLEGEQNRREFSDGIGELVDRLRAEGFDPGFVVGVSDGSEEHIFIEDFNQPRPKLKKVDVEA